MSQGLFDRLEQLGRFGLDHVQSVGRSGVFLLLAIFSRSGFGHRFSLLIQQLYSVGFMSLIIITVSGLFIGMVLALQGYNILIRYGSEDAVGQMGGFEPASGTRTGGDGFTVCRSSRFSPDGRNWFDENHRAIVQP